MTGLVYLSQAPADAQSASVDAALGYPRDGVDIGGGVHCTPAQSRTVRHAQVIQHPTLAQWAYPIDAVNSPVINPVVLATAVVLDTSWCPVSHALP
jgi:hypothetical protein